MKIVVVAAFLLVSQECSSRSLNDEESVVSVYTTLPSAGHETLNVYQQLADNIAERITSPIYRFFGFNATEEKTTKRPFDHVELPKKTKNIANNITKPNLDRDVEELSDNYKKKSDEKPEKITLFSSYLPVKENIENDTSLELDDVFKFDDDNKSDSPNNKSDSPDNKSDSSDNKSDSRDNKDDSDFDDDNFVDVGEAETPRGPLVYILELIGSIFQLLYGGFLNLFRPADSEK